MDDTDPQITFDEFGVCNHVRAARQRLATECFCGEHGDKLLRDLVKQIRAEGENKPYDCIAGVSGGVDSSYVILRAKDLGLRPLAVHLDNGWNTETAVHNIESLLRHVDVDLYTYVVDWNEMKDLQRSFILASVANVEVITDHAINAILFKEAARRKIRFIITGSNLATESIMPDSWGYDARDARHIAGVHRCFGRIKTLKSYPLITAPEFLWYIFARRIRYIPILNYERYDKVAAAARLQREFGWIPYERKHGESRFTRFFQEYYLPEKFRFDKRKAHLSSLIVAGQMTRDAALAELNKPLYRSDERALDIEYVTKKLGFPAHDWNRIMATPPRSYRDYPNNGWMFDQSRPLTRFVRRYSKGEVGKRTFVHEDSA